MPPSNVIVTSLVPQPNVVRLLRSTTASGALDAIVRSPLTVVSELMSMAVAAVFPLTVRLPADVSAAEVEPAIEVFPLRSRSPPTVVSELMSMAAADVFPVTVEAAGRQSAS